MIELFLPIILGLVCLILFIILIIRNKVIKTLIDRNDTLTSMVNELEIQRDEISKQRDIIIEQRDKVYDEYENIIEENRSLKKKNEKQ